MARSPVRKRGWILLGGCCLAALGMLVRLGEARAAPVLGRRRLDAGPPARPAPRHRPPALGTGRVAPVARAEPRRAVPRVGPAGGLAPGRPAAPVGAAARAGVLHPGGRRRARLHDGPGGRRRTRSTRPSSAWTPRRAASCGSSATPTGTRSGWVPAPAPRPRWTAITSTPWGRRGSSIASGPTRARRSGGTTCSTSSTPRCRNTASPSPRWWTATWCTSRRADPTAARSSPSTSAPASSPGRRSTTRSATVPPSLTTAAGVRQLLVFTNEAMVSLSPGGRHGLLAFRLEDDGRVQHRHADRLRRLRLPVVGLRQGLRAAGDRPGRGRHAVRRARLRTQPDAELLLQQRPPRRTPLRVRQQRPGAAWTSARARSSGGSGAGGASRKGRC